MEFGLLTHILSWEFYTRFFNVLFAYGFYYLPLLFFLHRRYLYLLNSDSNTSISAVSISQMFNAVFIYSIVFMTAVFPITKIDHLERLKNQLIPTVVNNTTTTAKDGVTVELNKALNKTYNAFKDGKELNAKIPALFAFYDVAQYLIIGGVQKVVAKLPINDIRSAIATTLQNDAIKDPVVKRHYNDFSNQCFNLAKNRFDELVASGDIKPNQQSSYQNKIVESDYNWPGGDYFINTPGFYKPCTKNSNAGICGTHEALQFMHNGKVYGCNEGWDWVYKQLKAEFKIDALVATTYDTHGNAQSGNEPRKKGMLRQFLKAEILVDPEEGSDWGFLSAIKAAASWVIGLAGTAISILLKTITTYLITLIIPLTQAFLLFVIVVLLPILLPLSGFKIEYIFSIFASMFAIQFVSVIIAVISIVDNSLLSLYSANSGSDNSIMQAVHIAGSGNGFEFFLINLLILLFYIVAIKIWFTFMVEFGGGVMGQIGDGMTGVADMGLGATGLGGVKKAGSNAVKSFIK